MRLYICMRCRAIFSRAISAGVMFCALGGARPITTGGAMLLELVVAGETTAMDDTAGVCGSEVVDDAGALTRDTDALELAVTLRIV
jgi:hypothetical protein